MVGLRSSRRTTTSQPLSMLPTGRLKMRDHVLVFSISSRVPIDQLDQAAAEALHGSACPCSTTCGAQRQEKAAAEQLQIAIIGGDIASSVKDIAFRQQHM
jgi:hypothetical protein